MSSNVQKNMMSWQEVLSKVRLYIMNSSITFRPKYLRRYSEIFEMPHYFYLSEIPLKPHYHHISKILTSLETNIKAEITVLNSYDE